MRQNHLPTAEPENSEKLNRLIKLTARLVDKILTTQGSSEALVRSKPDE
jgi:hypothetical protein